MRGPTSLLGKVGIPESFISPKYLTFIECRRVNCENTGGEEQNERSEYNG
jgi:hypothetical protein